MDQRQALIIDDDPVFIKLVAPGFTGKGYEVLMAGSGEEGLRLLFHQRPAIILLDVGVPGMDGWQTCKLIRDICDVPIIMLGGQHSSEGDIVRGLNCGADDYLIRPVGNEELLARTRAILRRTESPSSGVTGTTYRDHLLTVDVAERRIFIGGERVRLTPTEFRLFVFLLENAGRVLTHKQLLEKVWGWEYVDDIDHVRVYIWHLRKKIEPDPAHPGYIMTEPGVGYYFQKAA